MPGHLLFWVLLAQGGISVEVTDTCPGRAQIVSALEARVPGVTGPGATRRLELERADGLVLRLRGPDGNVELERRLGPEEEGSPERCAALAEAAGQVVARYLREIGYRPAFAPPPAPAPVVLPSQPEPPRPGPPAGAYLGLAFGGRAGRQGPGRGELLLGLQLHRARYAGEVAAGATTEAEVAVPGTPGATLRVRSYPFRLATGMAFWPGQGMTIVPFAGVSVELLSFRAAGLVDSRSGLRLQPAGELGVSYLVAGNSAFFRVALAGGWTPFTRDFDAGVGSPVFRTPDAYLRALLEVGWVVGRQEWERGWRSWEE